MVEELLEFSKMEDGRFTLQLEEMDLQAEFEDAIFTYRELFRQEGIELRYEPGEEILPPISGGAAASAWLCATRSCGSMAAPSTLPMPRAAVQW